MAEHAWLSPPKSRFRTSVQIDVSAGDLIVPGAQRIEFPQQLGDSSFELLAYPIETVLAEKILTALERGDANTRVRDYADVWRLIAVNAFAGSGLFEAVATTADHRGLKPGPLSERIASLVDLRVRAYREWRRRLGPDGDAYPEDFAEVVAEVIAFADPLLVGEVVGADWDPGARSWRR